MTENVIKKHQCPSCGGNLIVDSVKQMYSCSFCGSTYDYEYFREEEMYDLASSYLAHKEYYSRSGSSPMVDSIIMYITMGIATCAFLFFGLALGTEVAIIFAICAIVLDIVIGLIIYKAITPRVKAVDKIEKERGVLYVEDGNIRRRIKTLDAEADKLRLLLDRTCPGFVQKDKELTAKTEDKEVD